jgi:hypothetical protein
MTATVYHLPFVGREHDAFELTRDLRMGTAWCDREGIDPAEHAELYELVGSVDADTPAAAYRQWEAGERHTLSATRSMAVGDLVVIDDTVHFVDLIGFATLDMRNPYYDVPTGWYRDHLFNVGLPMGHRDALQLQAVIGG